MDDPFEQLPLSFTYPSRYRRIMLFPITEDFEAQATTEVRVPVVVTEPGRRLTGAKSAQTAQPLNGGNGHRGSELNLFDTVPLAVLDHVSRQQASSPPVMRSDISQAAGSAAFVSVGNIGGSILKYGSNVVIQRGFGPAGTATFGLYTLGLSIVNLITAIFNLGLDDAMVRYVSIYRAKRQSASLRGLTMFCTAVASLTGILGGVFMLFSAPFLASIRHSSDVTPILLLMAPLVPFTCMQTIWLGGLQGFKDFKWRVLLQRIMMPVVLILLLLGAVLLFHDLNVVVIATLIYGLVGALLSFYFFYRRVASMRKMGPETYELRNWVGFAAPNFLTSIIDTVLDSIDTLLLAFLAVSFGAIGQYGAALKLSNFVIIPQASFNTMFAPTIAELHSQGEHQKLAAMFQIVTKWLITFSLPIFWIIVIFSVSLLGISGQGFVDAWPLVVALAVGSLINVSTGSVGYILLMTGHTKTSFINSLTAVIVNVSLGIFLTPRYGAMGVAIATGVAVSVVNLMRLLQVRILLKMQPYRWDVLKPVVASLCSALVTWALLNLLSQANLALQVGRLHISFELALVPVFLAIYTGLLMLFRISPEDQIVLDMLRKKLKGGKKKKRG
jgi:O-antigen/teichoic acid export membrane protein